MNIIYKFYFLNGISEINQLFDDILIIWPAPVYDAADIYTLLHFKKENIMWKDYLATLQHEPVLNSAPLCTSVPSLRVVHVKNRS